MKSVIRFISYILIICCFLYIVACTNSSIDLEDYKFGIVYSSNNKGSIISTYNSTGEHMKDKKIKIGGITLASFMSFGIQNNNYMYYPCPVYKNKGNSILV